MKILFVSSGNSEKGISPIVLYQAKTMESLNVSISLFAIKGKGLKGYLGNIRSLKKHINEGDFDIIHAHYALSAFVASFAKPKRLVVSLMGSDVHGNSFIRLLIRVFNHFSWDALIVKSERMKNAARIRKAVIIPNGVDINIFRPLDKTEALKKTKWSINKKHILFAANHKRPEKNYSLASKALSLINDPNIELHHLNNVGSSFMPYLYNSADLILLTSHWEGSPNVIKEAMACNIPIVATDVGDIKWIFGSVEGCYLSLANPEEISNHIKCALEYSINGNQTSGRMQIIKLGLTSDDISRRIIELYKSILD